MKYLIFMFMVSFALACNHTKRGSGNIIKETRIVKSFDGISASGSIEVDIKTGETSSVIIETDDNIMPFVETNVSNNILKIKLRDINNLRNSTVFVHVVNPEFKNISSSASAEISATEEIANADKITLKASSGSSLHLKLNAPFVAGDASSGADINAKGKTRNVNSSCSSGASIDFSDLHAESGKASVSSGASISLFTSISLEANASSGGEIKYKGGASSVQKKVSSGGSINAQ